MEIKKSNGLDLSTKILDQVNKKIKNLQMENVEIGIDTFYNGREAGFVYKIYNYKKRIYDYSLCIWTYENRNSDDIVLLATTDTHHCDIDNIYTEDAYDNHRTFFAHNERNKVANEIVNLICNVCVD